MTNPPSAQPSDDAYAAYWHSVEATPPDRAAEVPADADPYTAFADSADL